MKKIISCLLVYIYFFQVSTYAHEDINLIEVFQSNNSDYSVNVGGQIIPFDDYGNGTYYTDNGLPCSNHSNCSYLYEQKCNCKLYYNGKNMNSIQCLGFANMVLYRLFGYTEYDSSNCYEKVVENVNPSSITETYLRKLISDGIMKPGAHIRTQKPTRKNYHSLIYMGCTDQYFYTYECNYDGQCGVGVIRRTWEEIVNYLTKTKPGIKYITMPVDYPDNSISIAFPKNGDWINPEISNTVSWTSIEDATSYKYSVLCDSGANKGTYLYQNAITSETSFTIPANTLEYEQRYKIWVGAFEADGTTLLSERIIYININGNTHPKILSYEEEYQYVAPGNCYITWSNVNGATHYLVSLRNTDTDEIVGEYSNYNNGTEPAFWIGSLESDTNYRFAVSAVIDGVSDTNWTELNFKTARRPEILRPVADSYHDADSVEVLWLGTPNADRYAITVSNSDREPLDDYDMYDVGLSTSCNISGLEVGKEYNVGVCAFIGEEQIWSEESVTFYTNETSTEPGEGELPVPTDQITSLVWESGLTEEILTQTIDSSGNGQAPPARTLYFPYIAEGEYDINNVEMYIEGNDVGDIVLDAENSRISFYARAAGTAYATVVIGNYSISYAFIITDVAEEDSEETTPEPDPEPEPEPEPEPITENITIFNITPWGKYGIVEVETKNLPQNYVTYLAAYKPSGTFSKIIPITIDENGRVEEMITLTDETRFKLFIWDSLTSLIPICPAGESSF